jgi:hypothetical protein
MQLSRESKLRHHLLARAPCAALLCNDLISPFDEGRRLDRQI